MKKHNIWITISIICLFTTTLFAQTNDTLSVQPKSIARTPTILSACLPGLGQIYNKKYWKVPIIYGGFAGLFYLYSTNRTEYNAYKEAFLYAHGDTTISLSTRAASLFNRYNLQGLESNKYYYKRNMDLSILVMAGLYFLNIIDANVDAHLKDFDIDENLSLHIKPSFQHVGLCMTLSIK